MYYGGLIVCFCVEIMYYCGDIVEYCYGRVDNFDILVSGLLWNGI